MSLVTNSVGKFDHLVHEAVEYTLGDAEDKRVTELLRRFYKMQTDDDDTMPPPLVTGIMQNYFVLHWFLFQS